VPASNAGENYYSPWRSRETNHRALRSTKVLDSTVMVTSDITKIQHFSTHESVLKPEITQGKLPSNSIKIIDLILGIL
jgi:hypothetical protein